MHSRILLGLAALVAAPQASHAQDDCFRKVVEFSEGICAAFVRLEGSGEAFDLQGEVNAELSGIFSAITDVGGQFGGSLNKDEYTNILRQDIPSALEAGRTCRLEVAKSFYDKICTPATGQALAQDTTFGRSALIEDPDGWTNVRTGAGTQFDAFARIEQGQIFQTFVQNDPWWQVRLENGATGYVHRSRIRLID